jgi:hypothetical protein
MNAAFFENIVIFHLDFSVFPIFFPVPVGDWCELDCVLSQIAE